MSRTFEPVIVGFLCNWCSYRAADLAGTARLHYAPNMRPIRVMCSGRVEPDMVIKALREGADGVLIAGCHPGECHYIEGNLKTLRRHALLRHLLDQFGIEPQRVQLVWASASEGPHLAETVDRMTEQLRALGPLRWSQTVLDLYDQRYRQEQSNIDASPVAD
jgi:F420-non-reducing hydrogenase iron-sulfur subunit